MSVRNLEILSREPYEEGRSFKKAGAYERIKAIAHYAVDPDHPANAGVIDLELAQRSDDGFVHFSGCLLYTSPSPRDLSTSRMPSSA